MFNLHSDLKKAGAPTSIEPMPLGLSNACKPNEACREKIVRSRGLRRGLLRDTLFLQYVQRPAKPRTAVRFRSPPPRLPDCSLKSTTKQSARALSTPDLC